MIKQILITTGIYPPDIGGSASYSSPLVKELSWPKGIRHFIYFLKTLWLGRKQDLILAADFSFGAAFVPMIAAKILRKKFLIRVTGDYTWEQGVQRFEVKDLMDDFQKKIWPTG